MIFSFLLLF
jgi:hypothetical protein